MRLDKEGSASTGGGERVGIGRLRGGARVDTCRKEERDSTRTASAVEGGTWAERKKKIQRKKGRKNANHFGKKKREKEREKERKRDRKKEKKKKKKKQRKRE